MEKFKIEKFEKLEFEWYKFSELLLLCFRRWSTDEEQMTGAN